MYAEEDYIDMYELGRMYSGLYGESHKIDRESDNERYKQSVELCDNGSADCLTEAEDEDPKGGV